MQTRQNIEVGDTVQLTASALFGLRAADNDAYQQMFDTRRSGGQVLEVTDDHVAIDIGQDSPLVIELSTTQRDFALQLVRKADADQPATAAPSPVATPAADIQSAVMQHPFMRMLQSQGYTPVAAGTIQLERTNDSAPSQIEPVVPQQVRLSQWVMNQFLGLKQYGIMQDLHRNDDARSGLPDPTGELWNKKEYRPVAVELSAHEDRLYNSALDTIREWITGKPTPISLHPEMATEVPTAPRGEDDEPDAETTAEDAETTAEDATEE